MTPFLAADFDFGQILFVVIFLIVGFVQWLYKLIQEKKEAAEREKRTPRSQAEVEEARRARLEQLQERRRELQGRTGQAGAPSPPRVPHSPPSAPTFGGPMAELFETLRRAAQEVSPPANQPRPAQPATTPEHGEWEHRPAYPQGAPAPPPLPGAPPKAAARVPTAAENRRAHSLPEAVPVPVKVVTAPAPLHSLHNAQSGVMSLETHLERQADVTTRADAAYNTKGARQANTLTAFLRSPHGYQQAFVLREVLGPPKALQSSDEWLY